MAPEEFQRGARIDERTTVFTLGRTAFVFLSDGLRGEPERHRWRASAALYDVAWRATLGEIGPALPNGSHVCPSLALWRV